MGWRQVYTSLWCSRCIGKDKLLLPILHFTLFIVKRFVLACCKTGGVEIPIINMIMITDRRKTWHLIFSSSFSVTAVSPGKTVMVSRREKIILWSLPPLSPLEPQQWRRRTRKNKRKEEQQQQKEEVSNLVFYAQSRREKEDIMMNDNKSVWNSFIPSRKE